MKIIWGDIEQYSIKQALTSLCFYETLAQYKADIGICEALGWASQIVERGHVLP